MEKNMKIHIYIHINVSELLCHIPKLLIIQHCKSTILPSKKKIYCPAHYKKTLSNFCLAAEINLTFSQPPQSAIKRPRSESGLDRGKNHE